MKKRPLIIWIVAVALIISPLYYYFERVAVVRIPWTHPAAVFASMAPLKVIGIAVAPAVGALVLQMRPISWFAILGYAAYAVVVNTTLLLQHKMQPRAWAINFPTALLAVLYFVRREVRAPYFHPRLRWWETDRVAYRAHVDLADGSAAETIDISPTGLYLATDRPAAVGTELDFTITIGDERVPARAVVVWASDGSRRVRGVGARFIGDCGGRVEAALRAARRRAEEREPFELHVDIRGAESLTCKTFDISPAGCFLLTDRPFASGQTLQLTLHLPEQPVTVDGTVVWARATGDHRGIGIRFATRNRTIAEQIAAMRVR